MIDKPILITGCARSGTSMTAGIVDICGGWGGRMSTKAESKRYKRAMYENDEIKNSLLKPCLKNLGFDPMGQSPLPDVEIFKEGDASRWRDAVIKIMQAQGYNQRDTWFYKGAKMCLMWPLWHRAFPKAKWIIVRRKDEDIVNSCLRTAFMRAHQDAEGWQGWVDHHKKRFEEMSIERLNMRELWPQKMISGNFNEVKFTIEELGLVWREKEVIEYISPDLWKEGK